MSSSSTENREEQATVVPSRRAENILMRLDEKSDATKKTIRSMLMRSRYPRAIHEIRSRSIELKRNEVDEITL
jgi:hypothetical protein